MQVSLKLCFLYCIGDSFLVEMKPKSFQYVFYMRNRKISGRIKRPPSQCLGIEMAVSTSIMVLEVYIPLVPSQ